MRKFFMLAVLAAAGILSSVSTASATFRLRVESGTNVGPGLVVTDNATGDLNGAANTIVVTGTIGSFTINVTTGLKTPNPMPGYYEGIDLNSVTVSSASAGTLRLILESDDFGAMTPDGAVTLVNQIGGTFSATAGSSLTSIGYLSDSNDMPNFGATDVSTVGTLAAIPGSGAGSVGFNAVATPTYTLNAPTDGTFVINGNTSIGTTKTGGYSVYNVITVNFSAGGGSVSFNSNTGTSPAPAGLLLAFTATPVLGLGAWIRRRREAAKA